MMRATGQWMALALLAGALPLLTSCMASGNAAAASRAAPQRIGQFDPARDLFFAHFDLKPDADDLHAIAAVGTLLRHPDYRGVRYFAAAGTTGTQGGAYIPAPRLMQLAFGSHWSDVQADPAATMAVQVRMALATLDAGGHIWVMEAGQSDHSARLFQAINDSRFVAPNLRERVHIVQHSTWNERHTTPEALAWVRERLDYVKIEDGNRTGNGTPGYNGGDAALWRRATTARGIGPLWQEARAMADRHNAIATYRNPTIAAGGFDFSDTAEASYIFGFVDQHDVAAFFGAFVPG